MRSTKALVLITQGDHDLVRLEHDVKFELIGGMVSMASPLRRLHVRRQVQLATLLVHNNWINITTDADGGLDDFSSKHPGGANLLFADGSVRFLRSITADAPVRRAFWAMGTRAGGEVIQDIE